MSLIDPSTPRPARVVVAGVVLLAGVLSAGVCGWGWAAMSASVSSTTMSDTPVRAGGAVMALIGGQLGAIALPIAAGFALPTRWRTPWPGGAILAGEYAAASVSAAVGAAAEGAPTAMVVALLVVGAVIATTVAAVGVRRGHRQRRVAEVMARGVATAGVVAQCSTSQRVNGVPRWRVVVRYLDTVGATRWYVDHRTTYAPPAVGQQVTVRYDPHRPGTPAASSLPISRRHSGSGTGRPDIPGGRWLEAFDDVLGFPQAHSGFAAE